MSQDLKEYAVLALRLSLGSIFLSSGLTYIYTGTALQHITVTTHTSLSTLLPLSGLLRTPLGTSLLQTFVTWGQILVGVSLLAGIFVTLGSRTGALLMLIFFVTSLPENPNPFSSEYPVYIAALAVLSHFKAGRVFGLDHVITSIKPFRDSPWIARILG